MNDHELDQLIRDASPGGASRLASLDLQDAQSELLEAIMALPDTDTNGDLDVTLVDVDPPPPTDERKRRRPRVWFAAAAAAAVVVGTLIAVRVADSDDPNVVTEPPAETPAELPRLLIGEVPAPLTLANVETLYGMEDGESEEAPGVVTNEGDGPVFSQEAYYSDPVPSNGDLGYLSLTAFPEGEEETYPGPGPGARPVTVRGHEGRIETRESSTESSRPYDTLVLQWQEAPGVMVRIYASGTKLTEEQLLAAAETIYEASDAEWEAGQHLNDSLPIDEIEALVPVGAQASVVVPHRSVAVYLGADGTVCATSADGRGQVPPQCADPDGSRASLLKSRANFPSVLYGMLPGGATSVVATGDGVDIEAQGDVGPPPPQGVFLDPTADGERTLYAVSVTWNTDLLTFLDAEGQTVETLPLDITPKL